MTNAEYRKYQMTQLILLREVDAICRELGLVYYMIGGTLLGAIRHGGFIPWDTDIDIAMPRKDYDKLKEYYLTHPNDKTAYQDFETEKNHLAPHALIRLKGTEIVWRSRISPKYKPVEGGVSLDIFPLDTPPKSRFLQTVQMRQLRMIRYIIDLKIGYIYDKTPTWKKALKSVLRGCLSPISLQFLNKHLDKVMRKYTDCGSGYLVSMASHYSYWKQLMPESVYGTPNQELFENELFFSPAQTDAYLTQIYGDYMKLPPKEEQVFLRNIDHIDYGTLEQIND